VPPIGAEITDASLNALSIHLDEDADAYSLLNGLRHRGWDVSSSREQKLLQYSDQAQLNWAFTQGRVLYTYNVSDFCRLHAEFLRQGRPHAGIIIGDQQTTSIGEELRRLTRICDAKTADEMKNNLEFLSQWKANE
jgi:hypothetical protein